MVAVQRGGGDGAVLQMLRMTRKRRACAHAGVVLMCVLTLRSVEVDARWRTRRRNSSHEAWPRKFFVVLRIKGKFRLERIAHIQHGYTLCGMKRLLSGDFGCISIPRG